MNDIIYMQKLYLTKLFKVIVFSLLLLFLISLNPKGYFDAPRRVVLSILLPFQKIGYSFSMGYQNVADFVSSIGQLKDENHRLRSENIELLARNAMLNDAQNENVVLREQLELLPRSQYELIASNVVSQDPNGLGNWIEIDRGSDDGVEVGMSVIVSKGVLIGRVQEVNAGNAKVMLLTNSKNTINATTAEKGARGIVKGEYGLSIVLDMVLQTDEINVGDNVVSVGAGGEIPRGLFIGTVQEVHNSEDNLFQQAIIASPLQVSKLHTVFVIQKNK